LIHDLLCRSSGPEIEPFYPKGKGAGLTPEVAAKGQEEESHVIHEIANRLGKVTFEF